MKYKFDEENHLHSLDGKPLIGTSTVVSVLSKPLTWWASGLAVGELGWTPINGKDKKPVPLKDRLPAAAERFAEIKELTDEEYLKLLDKAYGAHASTLKKSATKGTDMHAELEKYVKHCMANYGGIPMPKSDHEHVAVRLFADWAFDNVKKFLVSEGHCYSEKLWTGGVVDLLFEDKQERLGIMDFKSSKEAYISQFIQTAGYDLEISENGVFDSNGNQIHVPDRSIGYYAVFPFGMEKPAPQFHFETASARQGFKAAVILHRLVNQTN
jgi:hypothetical protein